MENKAIIAKCRKCGNTVAAYLDVENPDEYLMMDIIQCIKDGNQMEYVNTPVTLKSCQCEE